MEINFTVEEYFKQLCLMEKQYGQEEDLYPWIYMLLQMAECKKDKEYKKIHGEDAIREDRVSIRDVHNLQSTSKSSLPYKKWAIRRELLKRVGAPDLAILDENEKVLGCVEIKALRNKLFQKEGTFNFSQKNIGYKIGYSRPNIWHYITDMENILGRFNPGVKWTVIKGLELTPGEENSINFDDIVKTINGKIKSQLEGRKKENNKYEIVYKEYDDNVFNEEYKNICQIIKTYNCECKIVIVGLKKESSTDEIFEFSKINDIFDELCKSYKFQISTDINKRDYFINLKKEFYDSNENLVAMDKIVDEILCSGSECLIEKFPGEYSYAGPEEPKCENLYQLIGHTDKYENMIYTNGLKFYLYKKKTNSSIDVELISDFSETYDFYFEQCKCMEKNWSEVGEEWNKKHQNTWYDATNSSWNQLINNLIKINWNSTMNLYNADKVNNLSMNIEISAENYISELKLMHKQYGQEEDLYPWVYMLLKMNNNLHSVRLIADSNGDKNVKNYYKGYVGFPDMVILNENFNKNDDIKTGLANICGCVEVKKIYDLLADFKEGVNVISVEKGEVNFDGRRNNNDEKCIYKGKKASKIGQLLGELLWYGKVLYTNGLAWKCLELVDKSKKSINVSEIRPQITDEIKNKWDKEIIKWNSEWYKQIENYEIKCTSLGCLGKYNEKTKSIEWYSNSLEIGKDIIEKINYINWNPEKPMMKE